MKKQIFITSKDNDQFGQKLPTFRNNFCYIERDVKIIDDPDGIYDKGEYGTAKICGKTCIVVGLLGEDFEIYKVLS
jgi:hypothetical protein